MILKVIVVFIGKYFLYIVIFKCKLISLFGVYLKKEFYIYILENKVFGMD